MAVGVVALAIVAACWLYARGPRDDRSVVFRPSLRILRVARAARAAVREALESVRERL
jgi:hypothetical protein